MVSWYALIAMTALLWLSGAVDARSPGDPVKLEWEEGDVGGMTTVYGPDGIEPIGFVEYHQTRRGTQLTALRVTRFRDGSSDEDSAEARVGDRLEAVGGRSIVRDRDGELLVDMTIDVTAGRIVGRWGRGSDVQTSEQRADLPPGTYWGPLIFIVLRNFDANAERGRLVFRTVAPTPRPMVLDLEFTRHEAARLERAGSSLDAVRFGLSPTVHWMVDPLIRLIAPTSTFWIVPGKPPAMARFSGPRNYARQEIVIQ